MKRLFLIIIASGWLVACSSVPEPALSSQVSNQAVAAQQQQLMQLQKWRLRGQMAVFDLINDDRHGLYIDWHQAPDHLSMRFSHPLRGTLATLEQNQTQAKLIDKDGQEYIAATAAALINNYFSMQLPFDVLPELVLGRQLSGAVQPQYQLVNEPEPRALLSNYQIIAADQLWRAELRGYKAVQSTILPHSIDLRSSAWRIKLRVSEWQL